jgi:hypothetical protein
MAAVSAFAFPRLSPIQREQSQPPVFSGIEAFDKTGGLPRGMLSDLSGAPSSGRTSLLWSLLRAGADRGECIALVDACNSFDPCVAAGVGIDLSRLLWARCGSHAESALKAADLLVHAGGFALVVLDLSGMDERVTHRIPASVWFRLRRGAEQTGCAFVVTAERPLTGSCAQLQIALAQRQLCTTVNRLAGIQMQVEFRKGRPGVRAMLRAVR